VRRAAAAEGNARERGRGESIEFNDLAERFDASLLPRSALDATRSRGLTPDHCMRCDYAARANPPTLTPPRPRERATPPSARCPPRITPSTYSTSPLGRSHALRGVVTAAYPVPAVFPIARRALRPYVRLAPGCRSMLAREIKESSDGNGRGIRIRLAIRCFAMTIINPADDFDDLPGQTRTRC